MDCPGYIYFFQLTAFSSIFFSFSGNKSSYTSPGQEIGDRRHLIGHLTTTLLKGGGKLWDENKVLNFPFFFRLMMFIIFPLDPQQSWTDFG